MKLPTPKKFMTRRLTILLIVLIISAGAFAGMYIWKQRTDTQPTNTGTRPMNTVDYGPPTQQQKDDAAAKKDEVIKKDTNTKDTGSSSSTPTTTTSSSMNVTISRAKQDGGAGQPLNIRTIITGTTSGDCLVELKKDGQPTISKTFPIVPDVSYSICKQSDVDASDFSTGGVWSLSVIAKNGSAQSPAATNPEVQIKK